MWQRRITRQHRRLIAEALVLDMNSSDLQILFRKLFA
jgi:hypothetical protein